MGRHWPTARRCDSSALACAGLPDGTPVLVTAEDDIQVWSLVVTPSAQGLTGPIWTVGCVRLPTWDEVVVTAADEGRHGSTIQLWHADTGRLYGRLLAGHGDDALACTRLRDGTSVVVTPGDAGLRLWDLVSGQPRDVVLAGLTGELDVLYCVTLDDGTPILVIDEPVRAWDIETGQPYGGPLPVELHWRRARTADMGIVACIRLPDGPVLAAVEGTDDSVVIWASDHRQARHVITMPEPVEGLAFTGEHRLIVRTYLDITVYDLP